MARSGWDIHSAFVITRTLLPRLNAPAFQLLLLISLSFLIHLSNPSNNRHNIRLKRGTLIPHRQHSRSIIAQQYPEKRAGFVAEIALDEPLPVS
jgi:hypothetical protein